MKSIKLLIVGFLLVISMTFANAVSINQESQTIVEGTSLDFEASGEDIIYYEWDFDNAIPEKTVNGMYIFFTSTTHDGKFGETGDEALDNADAFCTKQLREAGIPGTCKAILSTSSVNAIDRIPESNGFYNTFGKIVAYNKNDLTSLKPGELQLRALIFDEFGDISEDKYIWTGSKEYLKSKTILNVNGAYTCTDWTSNTDSHGYLSDLLNNGYVGKAGNAAWDYPWSKAAISCSREAFIYGVQVDPIRIYEGTKIRMKKTDVQFNIPGEYTINLKGYKEGCSYKEDSITITVLENQAPVLTIEDQEVDENQKVIFPVIAEDKEYDQLTFSVDTNIEGYEFNTETDFCIGQEDVDIINNYYYDNPERYDERFDFRNIEDRWGNEEITIDILDIGEILGRYETCKGDENYDAKYDLSNRVRIFSWKTNYFDAGEYEVIFTVTDSKGKSSQKKITITVNDVNRLPTLNLIAPKNNAVNIPLNAKLNWQSSDPDSDILTYKVYFGTTPKLVLTQTTTTYDPELDYETTYYWKIIVNDGKDSVESDLYKFTTRKENTKPVISGLPNKEYNEDEGFLNNIINLDEYASDAEDDVLSYTITQSNPEIVLCSIDNNFIDCQTQQDAYGNSDITIKVSDGELTDTDSFTIKINSINDLPTANIVNQDTEIIKGSIINFEGQGSDIEGSVSYSWDFKDGETSTEQNPSHTFNIIGIFVVTLTVTDLDGASATDTVKITVTDVTGNHAPVISDIPDKKLDENSAAVDNAINLLDYASDDDGDSLTFSMVQSNTALVNAVIDGNYIDIDAPAADSRGLSRVCVKANDGSLDSNTACFNIKVGLVDMLTIDDLDVEVDDKTDTTVLNGETISKKALPGSTVTLKFKIKNIFTEDIEIEDIYVKTTLKGIDDGEDIEEESREFDLKKGKSKKISLSLDIPYKVEEGSYDLEIYVEGQDEDMVHEIDWTIKLTVEKDKHEVIIYKADLGSETLSCVRTTNLNIEVLNIGQEEEDNIKLIIFSPELGIDYSKAGIELTTDYDEEASYEKTIGIHVSDDFEQGTYPISIKVYRENELEDSEEISLTVEKCEVMVKEEKEDMEITKIPMIITPPEEKEIKIGFIIALGVGILVILVLIILAFYFGFRKR